MTTEGTSLQINKKFVSQSEIDEKRKQRQEEWEKVRKPDQPLEAPEEVYDPRSLYEQLQAQKNKKEEEHEAQFKLKNQVKGLEDDEAEFLDYVSDRQQQLLDERKMEEENVLQEYRNAVTTKITTEDDSQKKAAKPAVKAAVSKEPKKSQLQLLAGAVKRKSTDKETIQEKKQKVEGKENSDRSPTKSSSNTSADLKTEKQINKMETTTTKINNGNSITIGKATQQVLGAEGGSSDNVTAKLQVAGVLPGLGVYSDSDSSSDSSSSFSNSPVHGQNIAAKSHHH